MAKTDIPFSSLALWRCWGDPSAPTWLGDTPVNGWDTETSDGRIVVLSWAFEGKKGRALEDGGETLDPRAVFKRLTNRNARGACNVWYNLDFDANVILSHLPRNVVNHIAIFGKDVWDGYEITFLRGKLLCIRDEQKHKYEHFDVAHIFFQTGGSLDGALQAWLGRRKRNEKVDVKQFGNVEYLKAHWADIVKYAKADAEDVRDLWRGFSRVAEPLEIPCLRPFSTGFLAEQRYNVEFRKDGNVKPGFVSRELQEFAWKSYRGGRFEVIERGHIENVASYDINSAYPNVLRTLPDPSTVWWTRNTSPSFVQLELADYGFVEAVVSTDPGRPLQPFAIRRAGRLTFPVLDDYVVNATLPEFLYAVQSGLVTDFKVTDAWLGYADETTTYPFEFIDAIYAKRQELKKAGNTKAQNVLKIIINSMYGKLAQLTKVTEQTPPDGEAWRDHWLWHPIEMFPQHLRDWLEDEGITLHHSVKAGAYFNPMLASYVTGLTRLQLLRTAIDEGLENETVLLATDSITFRTTRRDELVRNVHASDLGAWSLDARGSMFVVGSGVYELTEADGTVKARTRGFEPGIGVYSASMGTTLREAAENAIYDSEKGEWVVPISNNRPIKLPEAIWRNIDLAEVGVFRSYPRGLSAGMDQKRLWPRGRYVTYRELLNGSERSEPLRWRGDCAIL